MKGDFSRGEQPDRKRGKDYCRVLMQQGRLLLDSDVNALVDAQHQRTRALASDLGCECGSPDLGYLLTPGQLLAVFEDIETIVSATLNITFYRDYSVKYLDRFPSLRIAAEGGTGSVTIQLRGAATGDVRFWSRAATNTSVAITGVAGNLVVPGGNALAPADITFGAPQNEIQINLNDGNEIWIGLIETVVNAGATPSFWVARGHYYLGGWLLSNGADALYSGSSYPVPEAAGDNPRFIAYLEGWERHITKIEDPGIQEQALGGDSDTTTRTEAIGQIKLVSVLPAATDAQIDLVARSLKSPELPDGTLTVTTPATPPQEDPCALPTQGGYTGPDNRLYRFEVHEGGNLGSAVIKWSRDNGSELFAAIDVTGNTLTFVSNTPLQGGDLVEALIDDTEFQDAADASVDLSAGTFQRPTRAVGLLGFLVEATGPTGQAYTLADSGGNVITLPTLPIPWVAENVKVRRWHGRIDTTAADTEYVIEDGITVALAKSFEVGDYWQYEARVAGNENDNGTIRVLPHGPERLFAPLALLQFTAEIQPLDLLRWLDHRFSPLCELNADDIAYDGTRVGVEECDTVQEALDKLFERDAGGCCEVTLEPSGDDDATRIREILNETANDGEIAICLHPGVYTFSSPVEIEGRKVVIKGCPRAVIVAEEGVDPMFEVVPPGRLCLEDLVLFRPANAGPMERFIEIEIVDPDDGPDVTPSTVEARGVGFIYTLLEPGSTHAAIRVMNRIPSMINVDATTLVQPGANFLPERLTPTVIIEACVLIGGWILSAARVENFVLRRTAAFCSGGGVSADTLVSPMIVESTIHAGFELGTISVGVPGISDTLREWTADGLLRRGDELIDSLDFPEGSVELSSVCLDVGLLGLAEIRDNQFVAGFGTLSLLVVLSELQHNSYAVLRGGIFMQQADEGTSIHGENIRIARSEGSPRAFGIRNLVRADGDSTGAGLAVVGCNISSTGTDVDGVAIGDWSETQPFQFQPVIVKCNQIRVSGIGINFGPQIRAGTVSENTIEASLGIFARGNNSEGGTSNLENAIRIADNTIQFSAGELNTRIGVYADAFLVGPTFDPIIENNIVEDARDDSTISVGFLINGGSGGRLSGNVVRPSFQRMVGLQVNDHASLNVIGNDFGAASCSLNNVDAVVFHNNRSLREVRIQSANGGTVTANRLGSAELGNLLISNTTGQWRIGENHADGRIVILPRLGETDPIDDLTGIFNGDQPGFVAINAIRDIASHLTEAETAPEFSEFLRFAPRAAVSGRGSLIAGAIDNPEWTVAWRAAGTALVTSGINVALGAASGTLVAATKTSRERPYQVLCIGNICRELQVGYENNAPSGESIVQVISNQALSKIYVNTYIRRIVAHNASGSYTGPNIEHGNDQYNGPNIWETNAT